MKVYALMNYVSYEPSNLIGVYSSIKIAEEKTGIMWSKFPRRSLNMSYGEIILEERIVDGSKFSITDIGYSVEEGQL